MKKWICLSVIMMGFLTVDPPPVRSQAQVVEGYTFIRGNLGPEVCLGQWIPSTDVALPGTCQGELIGVSQLIAISSGQSADRLAQIIDSLDSIDQRLAVGNDQLKQLIDATVSTQNSIDEQVRNVNEVLREAITRRFDELPKEMMASEEFKKEITKLKEEILGDVEKLYQAKPATPKK